MHSNHPALRQTFATQSRHWNRRLLVRLNATAPVWLTALHRSCARYRGIAAAGFEHSISPTMTLLSPRISRCCLSLIMDRRPTSARTARPRHLSAVSNFQIDVSRGRRTASSGMLALVSHCLQLTSSQSGRCGSLHLHRDGLPPSTFCRSPGAPVHSIITGSGIRCCVETLCRDVDICDDRDDPARGSAVRNLPNRADQSRDQRALDRHRRFFVPILGEPATTRQSLISCLERFHKSPMVAVRDTIPQRAQHIGEPLNKDFSSNRVRYRS